MNKSILTLSALIIFIAACKEKEIQRSFEDSPFITAASPARNQVFEDTDSVQIEAVIEPQNTSVLNYTV